MTGSIATRVGFAVRTLVLWLGLFPLSDAPLAVPSLPTPRSLAPQLTQQILFCLNSMIAWLMRTDLAIRQIEKLAWDWIKLDCAGGKCYGLLAVRPPSPPSTVPRFDVCADR